MNNLTVIKGVECYIDQDGIVQMNLAHVSRGLGFTEKKDGKDYVMWRRVDGYLIDLNFGTSAENTFIPEPIFYLLAMKASNEIAKEFQRIVAYEILPAIRKTGMYIPQGLSKELKAIFITDQKVQAVESRIEKLENTMTIDYSQQEEIRHTVSVKAMSVLGGYDTPAYKEVGRKAWNEIYRELKRVFHVNSYRNISVKDYGNALHKISCWEPTRELELMIIGANTGVV